ncbi:MAG: bifunctional UDP-N-acetylglucosamine diphosphorylase/glucosamine-1-phosphate N-acetyltransferase GlmU [Deltaproteobacteria bacterium]|nr:bifunctional UDP-N-acetylglucosamine diphosphorylase/glucosamine-1-phosphate N-acetyltransferase GlmU [Deltaproteobacteria bacterium]
MTGVATIILAAGKGTRMKSGLVKVLHPIMGKPMLSYPIDVALKGLQAQRTVVVVGHQAERIHEVFPEDRLTFVRQEPLLGSGHAVLSAEGALEGYKGTVLLLSGDVPLIEAETLKQLVAFHRRERSTLTVATTRLPDPTGYGRIVRGSGGRVDAIVEEKDASPLEREIEEVNTGIYCAEAPFLFSTLKRVRADNTQAEYYLTDIVRIGREENRKLLAFHVSESDQFIGINTRVDLARSNEILRRRTLERLMLDGVTIEDPATTYIEADVVVGRDTVIHPNCVIQGRTTVGKECGIGPNCFIRSSEIEDHVTIRPFSVVEESRISRGVVIGPFTRLRPDSQILEDARIGNFVEIKKSVVGEGSKVNHLAYVGDAALGERVNIGAGTIFCNYDGVRKHRTIVGNEVFVGSNTELIAPLEIGDHAVIGAGSTITGNVPEGSLAVSRVKQKNIKGWQKRKGRKR